MAELKVVIKRFAPLAAAIGFFGCEAGPRIAMDEIELELPAGSGEPGMMVTQSGDVVLSWHEPADEGHALKFAIRGEDGWSNPSTIVSGRPFFINWADVPSMVEFSDGSWAAHWLEKLGPDTYAYGVKVKVSNDRGATWSEPFTPHRDETLSEHGFVSMAALGDHVGAVWLDGRQTVDEGPMSLRFTTFDPHGVAGRDVLVDQKVCDCCNTSMVAVSDALLIAYRDRSDEEIRDIAVRRISNGEWSEPVHVGNDNWHYPGCPVNGPALSTLNGLTAIAWYSAPDQKPLVQVAFSSDRGRTFGEAFRIDQGPTLGRVDVNLLSSDLALVTYLNHQDEVGLVRGRLISSTGESSDPWTIAETSASRASGFPVVARAGDKLFFAWTLPGDDGGVRVTSADLHGVN